MSFLFRSICFLFFYLKFLNTFASPTGHLCRPDQRGTLMDIKSEFNSSCIFSDSYPKMESWTNKSDCCDWDGITCDAQSGVVIELNLSASCIEGQLNSNSSLFELRKLRVLNLDFNNLGSSEIPTKLGTLLELRRLNLSNAWMSGQIPAELLHLTKLVSLDLNSNPFVAPKSFLSKLSRNLTNLEELALGMVNISSEIPPNIFNLSSLKSIHLDDCGLFGELPSIVVLSPTLQSIDLSGNFDLQGSFPEFSGNNSLVLLDLSETHLSGNIPDSINNLKHLNSLNLHNCKFYGRLPSSLGNLSKLSDLRLESNYFNGPIPSSLGNLFHLTRLNLSFNRFDGQIPSSFVNLKKLDVLDISDNQFSGDFPLSILKLTKLTELYLANNHFRGTLPPNISSLSNLETFDATANTFSGTLPSSLFTIPSLKSILLNGNQFNHILEFEHISSSSNLRRLLLGHNHFRGSIPVSISKLVNLDELDLSNFSTGMAVDFDIFSPLKRLMNLDLSYLNTTTPADLSIILSHLKSISRLALSGNHVLTAKTGSISYLPLHLGGLFLSGCGITEFPEFIKNLPQISHLDLSNNKIKGQVPQWVWKLPMLATLNLSSNSFTGLARFSNIFPKQEIRMLDLSSNAFQGPLVLPPVSMEAMLASKNNFTGKIPKSICGKSLLQVLDLSSNNFTGSIPRCLWNLNNYLSVLNLRYNQLSGYIPEIFTNATELVSLELGHNRLVGQLPRSLKDCSKLEVLNVESNGIDGTFPFWLNHLPQLKVIVLRNNKFNGFLYRPPQHSFGFLKLQIIDISNNRFIGTLPSSYFADWHMTSPELFSRLSYIGYYGGSYCDSVVLMSKGLEMKLERIYTLFTTIDLSGNRLGGKIPESIGLLKSLIVLNLSSNGFDGNIPSSLANLTELESLDLSHNNLSGQIPPALGGLTRLSTIRVSHNKLVGPIPQGPQIETQDSSGFEGNAGLCGPPLDQTCGDMGTEQSETEEEEDEEVLSWTAAAISLGPGVILGLTIGYIVISQKPHWFEKKKPRHRGVL